MENLVKPCLKGDEASRKRLYDLNKRKMFGLCLRYANSREDAKDILQEGFLRVFRDLHLYGGKGSLEGWIRKIVLNAALDYVSDKKKKGYSLDLENHVDAMSYEQIYSVFENGRPEGLVKIMQQLPPGFRTVLNLYVIEGYTHAQIAAKLQISEGTSKSQLNRAKQKMRTIIQKSLIK